MAKNKAERQAELNEPIASTTDDVKVNEHATTATTEAPKEAKSIVPAKYAGRYKNGGSDDLANFIKSVCREGDKFEFTAFFQLARDNGIPEEQVGKYEAQVATKAQGVNGRARMTLRNMLATKVRKEGKLVDLAGNVHELSLPKPAVSGAAAKAQETKAAEGEPAPSEVGSEAGSETTDTTQTE